MTATASAPPRSKVLALLRGTAGMAIATLVMNVATYGFQMIAARLLGNERYGGIASLMNLLLIISVFQLGLQATAARRVASTPGDVREIEQVIKSVSYRTAAILGVSMLVLAKPVEELLRLDSIYPALLLAVTAVPLTVLGGQCGILQGERRWSELSLVYLATGVPRVIVGVGAMLVRPTEGAAMAAVALTAFAPAIVGAFVLRHRRSDAPHRAVRATVREMLSGSLALLGFFVLSNIDLLIARNIMPGKGAEAAAAGLYAGGLIVTKALLFLPQAVVVIAFPSMSAVGTRLRALLTSLGAIAGLGVLGIAGTAVLSGLALVFVGGDDYSAIQHRLWLFAVIGTFLSLLQLLVYSALARQHRAASLMVWAAVVVLLALGAHIHSIPRPDRLDALIHAVIAVDGVLTVALLALSLWHLRHDQRTPRPETLTA
ncbi:lipopolysaccharide biosynthesis protein [Nocardioides nematodiphilus]|uniref:lipopolysaccharide biosynthesis protein n=1 Tax=Nocardioides nematodiphilus TaxID=2849669 RepID=UPI001CD932E1|nr:polysaccharide biosynthesis protein [Nocardioides nematodiphilus]MCA1982545.1 polysaccharide biosynthesis protein [Nocardioides nematodiphilus]